MHIFFPSRYKWSSLHPMEAQMSFAFDPYVEEEYKEPTAEKYLLAESLIANEVSKCLRLK